MTRMQQYGFAAIAAAVLTVVGTWSLVHAQQAAPAGAGAAPAVRQAPNQPGAGGGFPGMGRMPGMAGGGTMMGPPGMGMGMGGMMGSGSAPQEYDPEMAELAEAEATLASHADELLTQYVTADATEDQKQVKSELHDTLAKQFDVQRQRRELELQRIEERVQKLRDQIKKRNDARDTIIERRFEQLISEADGLGWGPPTSPNARGMSRSSGSASSASPKKSRAGEKR